MQSVTTSSKNFPQALLQTPDPPKVLFCRGNQSLLNRANTLAMVGSRKHSDYGRISCQQLISGLRNSPIIIVSGLAFGIDALCHEQALENNLATIAVLATGVDDESIYPRANYNLAHRILANGGLLISEYDEGTKAKPFQFIARNRIIAGLSNAIAIVECPQKSGALITADFGLDYNKSIFAVPGNINSQFSRGPNQLIKQGANPLTSATDLLNFYNISLEAPLLPTEEEFSESEKRVLECMKYQEIEFDALASQLKYEPNELMSVISQLELKGAIIKTGLQTYQIKYA